MIQKNYDFADHLVHSMVGELKLTLQTTSSTFFAVWNCFLRIGALISISQHVRNFFHRRCG